MTEPRETPTLRESLRSLPGPTYVLFAGTFVLEVGSFVLPFFTLFLIRNGYSAPQAGAAIAAYGLGELVAQITGGLLADRIGRRNAIALSMFSAGTLTLALWRAQSLALIYPLMFGFAWASELSRPAASALIADLVPSRSRVAAFTLLRLAINVGGAVGLALGGFLAERSFDLLFVGDAATSIAFGLISLIAASRRAQHLARGGRPPDGAPGDPRGPRVPLVPAEHAPHAVGVCPDPLDATPACPRSWVWALDLRWPALAQRRDRRAGRAPRHRVGPTTRAPADDRARAAADRARLRVAAVRRYVRATHRE